MTPWHLADLESSLVSACPGSSTDIPYTDCWGVASAGSHWDLCHIECPNSGAAVIASVSVGRRRAGTAWTHTQSPAQAHSSSQGSRTLLWHAPRVCPAHFTRTQTFIEESSPSASYTRQGMLQESIPWLYRPTWTLPTNSATPAQPSALLLPALCPSPTQHGRSQPCSASTCALQI